MQNKVRVRMAVLCIYTLALTYVWGLILLGCYYNGATKLVKINGHQYEQTLDIQGSESAIKHSAGCPVCNNIVNSKK